MHGERARTIAIVALAPCAGAGPEIEHALIGTVHAETDNVMNAGLGLSPCKSSEPERRDQIESSALSGNEPLSPFHL